MKNIVFLVAAAVIVASSASAADITPAELTRLHQVAAKCDLDNSGVPDIDTCVPTYDRLIKYYGGYTQYVAAAKEWKAKNGG